MIAVAGEALIDLVVSADQTIEARPGGGPYNAARTMARLGLRTTFLGRLSGDGFGCLLGERLSADGVAIGVPARSAAPSTLAVATVGRAGAADYSFYLDGTAAADLTCEALMAAVPPDLDAIHVGTLGLVMEPVGTAIERLVGTGAPPGALVLLDPNCRPGAIADRAAYLRRVTGIARRADIVKASTEDLAYLYPGLPPGDAARELLGAGPSLVLVTDGHRPCRAFLAGTVMASEVPAVTVADTIGAGDSFGGGFLAWWTARGLGREDLRRPSAQREENIGRALRAAAAVAALTCTRRGAEPPTLAEARDGNWWPA